MSFPPGPSSNRQDLMQNAILFLNDPKVQSSTLTSRITFLESKGLNEHEIQEALRQASSAQTSSFEPSSAPPPPPGVPSHGRSAYGYGQVQGLRPESPKRDWRDLFIMAVVSGGVMYGLTALARKYLLPHLQPPSSTSFQSTSASLTAQYDEAARLLYELQEQTTQLSETIEGDRERVNGVVGEVEEAVKGVEDGEERWRDELREIRGEVESVRELVPRMIEKHAATQSSSLADLQSELRSLKTLLQSRQASASAGPNGNGIGNGSSVSAAADKLLAPRAGKGIPAWQMAPTSGSPGGSSANSLAGSGTLEKDKEEEAGEVGEVKEDGVSSYTDPS